MSTALLLVQPCVRADGLIMLARRKRQTAGSRTRGRFAVQGTIRNCNARESTVENKRRCMLTDTI